MVTPPARAGVATCTSGLVGVKAMETPAWELSTVMLPQNRRGTWELKKQEHIPSPFSYLFWVWWHAFLKIRAWELHSVSWKLMCSMSSRSSEGVIRILQVTFKLLNKLFGLAGIWDLQVLNQTWNISNWVLDERNSFFTQCVSTREQQMQTHL